MEEEGFIIIIIISREERSGREGGVSVRNVTSSIYKHSGGCMCEAGIDQRDQKERRLWVLSTLGTETWVPARRTEITRLTDALVFFFLYQGGCLAHFLYSWRRFCFALLDGAETERER